MFGNQCIEPRHFIAALEGIRLSEERGRPRKRCRYIVADKGYGSVALRQYCSRHHMKPIIPQRKPRPGYFMGSISRNIVSTMP